MGVCLPGKLGFQVLLTHIVQATDHRWPKQLVIQKPHDGTADMVSLVYSWVSLVGEILVSAAPLHTEKAFALPWGYTAPSSWL
jgi:hypothetical protein